jgi:membrane-bound lytic murein transglycosylase B
VAKKLAIWGGTFLVAVLCSLTPTDTPTVDAQGGWIPALVDEAADHYGLQWWARQQAHRVIWCESKYRNIANYTGSGATGPAQFMPRTFYANAPAAGFAGASIWNERANVFTAVYMMGRGWWSHWNASRYCWG